MTIVNDKQREKERDFVLCLIVGNQETNNVSAVNKHKYFVTRRLYKQYVRTFELLTKHDKWPV